MFGRLAQLVEHQSYKLGVVGSNPSPPTSHFCKRNAWQASHKDGNRKARVEPEKSPGGDEHAIHVL